MKELVTGMNELVTGMKELVTGLIITLGYVKSSLGNIFGWVSSSSILTGQSRVPNESVSGSNDPNLLYIFPVH
jgi:X-X-X-Leu-X-X-Gly heptad repeat protein